jgi:L-alanine-DL-glutamate epimerase-like enolase superfamily enzyme
MGAERSSGTFVIEALEARRLSVPLEVPFVIASGRVDATRSVEVEARIVWRGVAARGLGEASCLPPVTREDQDDVLQEVGVAAKQLVGRTIEAADPEHHGEGLELGAALGPVTRAGIETALLDAFSRARGLPLRSLLGGTIGAATRVLETDVTIAIGEPEGMGELARRWAARGFRALKIKVGKDLDSEVRAIAAIARAAPRARLRIDANGGYTAKEAIALARECERLGVDVECWEQPCASEDVAALAQVAAALNAPVVADESVKTLDDVRRAMAQGFAGGVNLKLAKSGGLLPCMAMGRAARAGGLKIMVGGMVETRLGMTAAAHLACALGGVDFVDLDTAWLLADDPYEGGYAADGPTYTMPDAPGLAVDRRAASGAMDGSRGGEEDQGEPGAKEDASQGGARIGRI